MLINKVVCSKIKNVLLIILRTFQPMCKTYSRQFKIPITLEHVPKKPEPLSLLIINKQRSDTSDNNAQIIVRSILKATVLYCDPTALIPNELLTFCAAEMNFAESCWFGVWCAFQVGCVCVCVCKSASMLKNAHMHSTHTHYVSTYNKSCSCETWP